MTDSSKAQQYVKEQSGRKAQPNFNSSLNRSWYLLPGYGYSIDKAMEDGLQELELYDPKLRS